jgi:serine/threonine protein kinase/Flp pilus assembly protein TadD
MTPERWQQVKKVLNGALELAPEQRPAYLDQICSTDDSLRRNVESMLESATGAESAFLPTSTLRIAIARGAHLGDYEVQSLIGSGGMGEVYRARDLRLHREVAIKVLPSFLSSDPERLRRFEQEARAAAALNHPNILAVFQMGTYEGAPYLVSELLEGLTLREQVRRGALPVRKAIDYAVQIAHGLAAAHDKGIVHRDLKPENLFVTKNERVKILDFGLAKLMQPTAEDRATTLTGDQKIDQQTEAGIVLGTVGYMSPEQVRGEPTDYRADIFAFGAVLYEMFSGRRAFQGQTAADTMGAILRDDPPPLSQFAHEIPPGSQRIVQRCMEKNPEQRFHAASDLAFALESLSDRGAALSSTSTAGLERSWLRHRMRRVVGLLIALVLVTAALLSISSIRSALLGSKPQRIQSIAVLPLENLSHDAEQEYFANGMTDALITDLAKSSRLRVISRTSIMSYKDTKKNLPGIAHELGVDAIVEGSVMASGNRVRITAQLIEAHTDKHLWAESYERDVRDILSLQDDVASAIATAIQGNVAQSQKQPRPQVDPDAYRLYLKGMYYWDKRTAEGFQKATEYLNQAIDKDPSFALAYSSLAENYLNLSGYSLASTREVLPKARVAALKSLELDDTLSDAHRALATIYLMEWNFPEAEKKYREALALNPNDAGAHQGYGALLARMRRLDEASVELTKATELDPLWLMHGVYLGNIYYYQRRYDEAVKQYNKVLEMNSEFWLAHGYRAFAYEKQKRFKEADADLQKVLAAFPHTNAKAAVGELYALQAKKAEAHKIIRELKENSKKEYVSDYWLATVYVALGEKDEAFRLLENAYNERSFWLIDLKVDPRFDDLHSDVRFQDLLHRVGFPQ